MFKYLNSNGVNFLPSRHGYQQKNYTFRLEEDQIEQIIQEAFIKTLAPSFLVGKLIKATLASGVCSGISAYVLQRFFETGLKVGEESHYLAVLQSRTWGRPFILESLHNYFLPFPKRLKRFKDDFGLKGVFIVFLPRALYPKNIYTAHTVVPYGFSEGLAGISVFVYDSNYPGDDSRLIRINKNTGHWVYDDFSADKWLLTINSMENLTHKVSFLL
ncbi:MAG: hypothetical protein ACOYVD_01675 [Bacillota bacterium]